MTKPDARALMKEFQDAPDNETKRKVVRKMEKSATSKKRRNIGNILGDETQKILGPISESDREEAERLIEQYAARDPAVAELFLNASRSGKFAEVVAQFKALVSDTGFYRQADLARIHINLSLRSTT